MTNYREAKEFLKATYDISNVATGSDYYTKFLLSKCQNLFVYENLPDTLNAWEIEKSLIIKGNGAIIKKKGQLYIPFTGSVYGYDEYNVPNKFTFAQPLLGGGNYTDNKDCVILWNMESDKMDYSSSLLFEVIKRYARMLADVDSTIHSQLIGKRMCRVGMAQNSQVGQAVDEVLSRIEIGENRTIINPQMLIDGFKPLDFNGTQSLGELTQMRDYILNCFYNEIGLQTLEEKKERMIVSEVEQDDKLLSSNIDEMYDMRLRNIEKVNKLFNTSIIVRKSGQIADYSTNEKPNVE